MSNKPTDKLIAEAEALHARFVAGDKAEHLKHIHDDSGACLAYDLAQRLKAELAAHAETLALLKTAGGYEPSHVYHCNYTHGSELCDCGFDQWRKRVGSVLRREDAT